LILIREFKKADIDQVLQLYKNTTLIIIRKDYTEEQVKRWAAKGENKNGWLERIESEFYVLVAEIDNAIVGFGEINDSGFIDNFYIHHDHLGKGIGKKIMMGLEAKAKQNKNNKIYANVSVTAFVFFKKMGFSITKTNVFTVCESPAVQYEMEKKFKKIK